MNFTFDKKSKKSLKVSQRHLSLGIPTNIAAGPLGFRAELDIGPKGGWRRSCHDIKADQLDSTVTLDEENTRALRIALHDRESEDQVHPVPETPMPGVVNSTECGNDPTSECCRSLLLRLIFIRITVPLPIRRERR